MLKGCEKTGAERPDGRELKGDKPKPKAKANAENLN
jgi:hypothetical protein